MPAWPRSSADRSRTVSALVPFTRSMRSPSTTSTPGRASGARRSGRSGSVAMTRTTLKPPAFSSRTSSAPSDAGHAPSSASRRSPPRTKMWRAESRDHLRQDVAEFRAVGHPIDQRLVLLPHRGPVEAMHAAVVEVVALEAPGFGEHLPPLEARIEAERPVLQRHGRLREVRRRLGAGVHHVVGAPLADQDLPAVGRQLVACGPR